MSRAAAAPRTAPIPRAYPLLETPTADYPQRTAWNVRDSDGTLILHDGRPDRGTALTERLARRPGPPLLVLDLAGARTGDAARWINAHHISVLNVAGPRESRRPGIQGRAARWLNDLLASDTGPRQV